MGYRGLSRVQWAQWGAGGLSGVPGGRRVMQQQGGQGGTDLQAWSTPKNGGALCVPPTLSPSLTPWLGCAPGLVNPQRPKIGPPRRYKLMGWPLDSCVPLWSPLPHAPGQSSATPLSASVSPPSLHGDTGHPISRQARPRQASGLLPGRARESGCRPHAAGQGCRSAADGGSERRKEKWLCLRL